MASDYASSDIEGSPTSRASPTAPSWWSDSDGRRSHRRSANEESPWWESDSDDKIQWECEKDTPLLSPFGGGNITSPSSGTPAWWSDPSSRQLSTSGNELEEIPRAVQHIKEGDQESGTNDEVAKSMPKKNRKRFREQFNVLGDDQKEPPTNRLKLTPLSPHADLATVANDIKKGIVEPLQIFLLFFTVGVIGKICDLTNTHGWEVILFNSAFANDDGAWEDITLKEMQIFIAIILIMRRHPDVGFGSFWREDRVGEPWPRTLMKRSRFFAIIQLLRVADLLNIKKTSQTQDSTSFEAKKIAQDDSTCSSRFTEKLDHFLYFFDQIKTVLKIFQPSFNIQFAEKAINGKVSTEQDEILNLIKVVPSTCKLSDELKNESSTMVVSKLVSDLKPDILESSRVLLQANLSGPSNLVLVNGQESSKEDSKELAHLPNDRPGISEERPAFCNNSISDQSTDFTVISLKWHNRNLDITADSGCSENGDMCSGGVTFKDAPYPRHWRKVFLPCPEVIYEDARNTQDNTDSDVSQISGRPSNSPFFKSFFYHYLDLARYFSTTKSVLCSVSGCPIQNGEVLSTDLEDQIISGLISLGDAGSLSQSDSDSEMRESDVSCDTSSEAEGVQSGDESDSGAQKLHMYVQARSRVGQKCALCWSLQHEVRKVHTRCARCGRHFCLSRFRNCMDEAHNDLEMMQQILDEEPS